MSCESDILDFSSEAPEDESSSDAHPEKLNIKRTMNKKLIFLVHILKNIYASIPLHRKTKGFAYNLNIENLTSILNYTIN